MDIGRVVAWPAGVNSLETEGVISSLCLKLPLCSEAFHAMACGGGAAPRAPYLQYIHAPRINARAF